MFRHAFFDYVKKAVDLSYVVLKICGVMSVCGMNVIARKNMSMVHKLMIFLAENFHLIPKGKILSLAEGEGRNAVFLAQQGYTVTAVDSSLVGLEKAQRLAAEKGVKIDPCQYYGF